jgi:hypothetical protein
MSNSSKKAAAPVTLSEEERAAWDSWFEAQTDNAGVVDLVRRSSAYLTGWRSRDAELSALRSQLEALMPYAQHKPECRFGLTELPSSLTCTCALASLLAEEKK